MPQTEKRKILYVDMDGTIVDFDAGKKWYSQSDLEQAGGDYDNIPGYFRNLPPMEGALDAFRILSERYHCYILSTAPWDNPSAWIDKRRWIGKHLPQLGHKRLILSHHKGLLQGDYLIDDNPHEFDGEHLHFGENYPDWESVLDYLLP